MIGAAGKFGIHCNGRPWVALHESVEGWIESLALADHAARWARQVSRLTGDQVEDLDLDGYRPVGSVRGLSDTWWRGSDTLVAVYRGETLCMGFPPHHTALMYSGLEGHGLSALDQHCNQPWPASGAALVHTRLTCGFWCVFVSLDEGKSSTRDDLVVVSVVGISAGRWGCSVG